MRDKKKHNQFDKKIQENEKKMWRGKGKSSIITHSSELNQKGKIIFVHNQLKKRMGKLIPCVSNILKTVYFADKWH